MKLFESKKDNMAHELVSTMGSGRYMCNGCQWIVYPPLKSSIDPKNKQALLQNGNHCIHN
jgi:hypothetical protein